MIFLCFKVDKKRAAIEAAQAAAALRRQQAGHIFICQIIELIMAPSVNIPLCAAASASSSAAVGAAPASGPAIGTSLIYMTHKMITFLTCIPLPKRVSGININKL